MKITGIGYKHGYNGLGHPLMDEIVISVCEGEDIYVEDKGDGFRYVKVRRKEDSFTERAQKRTDELHDGFQRALNPDYVDNPQKGE